MRTRLQAVLWYNHAVDERGGLGEMDRWSLHGGCPVLKGEKWIVTFWIRIYDELLQIMR